MEFSSSDLGNLSGGEIVEVTLKGTEANVLLLDNSNFNSYKSGGQVKYYGGHFKKSPVRIEVPHADHWYVVVDLGGFTGSVNVSVRVLSR